MVTDCIQDFSASGIMPQTDQPMAEPPARPAPSRYPANGGIRSGAAEMCPWRRVTSDKQNIPKYLKQVKMSIMRETQTPPATAEIELRIHFAVSFL